MAGCLVDVSWYYKDLIFSFVLAGIHLTSKLANISNAKMLMWLLQKPEGIWERQNHGRVN